MVTGRKYRAPVKNSNHAEDQIRKLHNMGYISDVKLDEWLYKCEEKAFKDIVKDIMVLIRILMTILKTIGTRR